MGVTKMKLIVSAAFLGVATAINACSGSGDKECPVGGTTYQWCRENFRDYVAEPDVDGNIEKPNPTHIKTHESRRPLAREPRENWQVEFKRVAARLLAQDPSITSNKEIADSLLSYFQQLWPTDGWVFVVVNNNESSDDCMEMNSIDSGTHMRSCFDHWYSGCREEVDGLVGSKACRNEIISDNNTKRTAIGVQVNRAIEHMIKVDKRHVFWFTSHAEGCYENGECGALNQFGKPWNTSADRARVMEQISAPFGVSAMDFTLKNDLMRSMAAKIVWQHYRQGLDREFITINNDYCSSWDTLITFCSKTSQPDGNNVWGDIAWNKVNIDDAHYFTDYQQYEIGLEDDWYGNNGVGQCVTIGVVPFSH